MADVVVRRVDLAASFDAVPKFFAADEDPVMSHLLAVLSAVFPDGEEFFVRSVRRFRDQISDADLRRQVAGFIGQEAVHGREHRAFNDRLHELGYPTKRIERLVSWGLAVRERIMSPASNLAATAAFEHFTATLAELLLVDEELRALIDSQPVMDLFAWHALEESEHKAVAFDVYRAVGGSERMRVVTMNVITVGFLAGVATHVVISMLGDRETRRGGGIAASLARFRHSPLMRREVWRRLRAYNRRDFHPDERDTAPLVARWRAELFGARGRMTERLPAV